MIMFRAVRETAASIVRPEDPRRPATPAMAWTLAAIVLLSTWAIQAAMLSPMVQRMPVPVWHSPAEQPAQYRVGETFRSGALGYTVHGADERAGQLAVELRVHNPGPGAVAFSPSWAAVETVSRRAHEPDLFASLRASRGGAAPVLADGESARLTIVFSLPEQDPARRLLVSGGIGYEAVMLRCLTDESQWRRA